MSKRGYFDWNATAPLREEAREAMLEALAIGGNASSVHAEGRAARAIVERARAQVAALVGAQPREVIFTSGGTEANALALTPRLETATSKTPRDRLLVSAIEHPSVRAGHRFAEVTELPVTEAGIVDLVRAEQALESAMSPLISLMLANNETGVVQPVREMAAIVHRANGLLHVDAVQGPGRIACDINDLDADLLTISAHKIGGPQGAGALIRRGGVHVADQMLRGGGQERGLRAGTENVSAIAGFGAAAAAVLAGQQLEIAQIAGLRDALEAGLRSITPQITVFGADSKRLPNTTLFALPGAKAETAIIAFDLNGLAVSSGSACSSGRVAPSHVLEAMGVAPDLAKAAVRLSIGRETTADDIGMLLLAWRNIAPALSKGHGIAA